LAAKVNKCFGVKLATTYAYIAASALPSHPSLAVLFLAQSNCALRGRISARLLAVARRRRTAMVRVKSMELILRQQRSTGVLMSPLPLLPAMPLLLSPHILL